MYNPPFRTESYPSQPAQAATAETIGLLDVMQFLKSSYKLVVACALFAALAGFIFCLTATPSFTAVAQVLIGADRNMVFQEPQRAEGTLMDSGLIESQIEIIKSDRTAQMVIRKLDLLADPEFGPREAPPSFLASLRKSLFPSDEGVKADRDTMRMTAARDALASRLNVRRIGQSFVVEVQFRSNDAARSALIANTILEVYITADIDAKANAARLGGQWILQRLTELREQATEARRSVEQFKASGEAPSMAERSVKLADLESISNSQARLYDVFLQRYLETQQKVTYPVADARIIADASMPLVRSFPKTNLIVAFMGLLGATAGAGIAMLRVTLDTRVRSLQRLETYTKCGVLGVIARSKRPLRNSRIRLRGSQIGLALAALPKLPPTEDFKVLKTALNGAVLSRTLTRIGVTSVNAGEGKTTVIMNLANLFATSGLRTLAVDMCSQNPALSLAWAPDCKHGLLQAIDHPDMLSRLVLQVPQNHNLFVLPVGAVAEDGATPAERLSSSRRRKEIDMVGAEHDLTFFDLPDMRTSSDALSFAPFLHGFILVVEYGKTKLTDVEAAVQNVRKLHGDVIGIVVNNTGASES